MAELMKTQHVLTVGNATYTIGLVRATDGLRAGTALLRAAGPGLEGLRGGFMTAIGALCRDPALETTLLQLCQILSPATKVQVGDQSVSLDLAFEEHFKGNYGALLKWLSAAVELNLESFLDELSTLFQRAKDEVSNLSARQQTAEKTGPSGG
jgi:hypothetical protein